MRSPLLKKALFGILVALAFFAGDAILAQNPVYEAGPVWRVVYYRFKPGQATAFWTKGYPGLKAVAAEAQRQGEVIDSQFFANPLKARPDDWDIMLMLKYPNYAALDGLGPKSDAVYKKLYPPEEAEKHEKERAEILEVLSVHLVREIPLK